MNITLTEKTLQSLHKFLARADLKGHEVPEFVQLLRELRPAEPPPESPTTPSR
jgi:hypothetical protein